MEHQVELLTRMYEDFNARRVDAVLAKMDPNIAWPNGWEGGTVIGHEGVRGYWTRQWAAINPTVVPLSFDVLADGRIKVDVRQCVRNLAGEVLSDHVVTHTYRFEGDLISGMEIGEP